MEAGHLHGFGQEICQSHQVVLYFVYFRGSAMYYDLFDSVRGSGDMLCLCYCLLHDGMLISILGLCCALEGVRHVVEVEVRDMDSKVPAPRS